VDAKNAPTQALGINDRLPGRVRRILNDGAISRQIALGTDSLCGPGIIGPARVLLVCAGEVISSWRLAAVLPQLHPDFFLLFTHGINVLAVI